MCGIVGYIGKREAYPILIKGLKRLEYRGYDSAGVALISIAGDLNVYKAKGKGSDLERSTGSPIRVGPRMASRAPKTPIPITRHRAIWR